MRANTDARNLIALAVITIILVAVLSFQIRNDNVIGGAFRLDDIALCEDLDDNFGPTGKKELFDADARQVCLWFEYSRARDGDMIEVVWQFNGEDIQSESFRLIHQRGARAFYLIREDGSALPPGHYSVSLLCNGRSRSSLSFFVDEDTNAKIPASEDISQTSR